MGRIWGWVSAGLGFAVLALILIEGIVLGTWVDEHGVIDMPSSGLLFIAAGIGLILIVGGIISAIRVEPGKRP
jgi:hypothetical protein